MKKHFLIAAVAGLTLVSAHPPADDGGSGAREARSGYPPCSRTVRDRCIQRYERGVRVPGKVSAAAPPASGDQDIDVAYAGHPEAATQGHRPPAGAGAHHPAVSGPRHHPRRHAAAEPARHYPPCTARLRDRCNQQRHYRPVQLAMRVRRAGERG